MVHVYSHPPALSHFEEDITEEDGLVLIDFILLEDLQIFLRWRDDEEYFLPLQTTFC